MWFCQKNNLVSVTSSSLTLMTGMLQRSSLYDNRIGKGGLRIGRADNFSTSHASRRVVDKNEATKQQTTARSAPFGVPTDTAKK